MLFIGIAGRNKRSELFLRPSCQTSLQSWSHWVRECGLDSMQRCRSCELGRFLLSMQKEYAKRSYRLRSLVQAMVNPSQRTSPNRRQATSIFQ